MSYRVYTITLAAGEARPLALSGEYFQIMDADDYVDVALGEGAAFAEMEKGVLLGPPGGFGEITFRNPLAVSHEIRFAVGRGFMRDGRLNVIGGPIDVNMANNAATDLRGATYAKAENTTATIVSAAVNVNGVRIVYAGCSANASDFAAVRAGVGGDYIALSASDGTNSTGGGTVIVRDVILPAGVDVALGSSGTQSIAFAWYEVL